eukprot:3429633-Pleurochrysis_carterae.AAC.1
MYACTHAYRRGDAKLTLTHAYTHEVACTCSFAHTLSHIKYKDARTSMSMRASRTAHACALSAPLPDLSVFAQVSVEISGDEWRWR